MTDDGEREQPVEFSVNGERADADDFEKLDTAAFVLSELASETTVHCQVDRVNPETGDAIFFKTYYEEPKDGTLPEVYATIGVAKGEFENVQLRFTFDAKGKVCGADDSSMEQLANALAIMEDFINEDLLESSERAIVKNLILSMSGNSTDEVVKAWVARKENGDPRVKNIYEILCDAVAKNTTHGIRQTFSREHLDDDLIISIVFNEILGEKIPEDSDEPIVPELQIELRNEKTEDVYVYTLQFNGVRFVDISNPTLDEENPTSEVVKIVDENGVEYVIELGDYTPGKAHIHLLTEKVQEAIIRTKNREQTHDKELMQKVHDEGARLLLGEFAAAPTPQDYIRELGGKYGETAMFHTLKEMALMFGMFEIKQEPEYSKDASFALMEGLLLGMHVAATVLPGEVLEQIDNVEFSELTIGFPDRLTGQEVEATDDTASRGMEYYEAAKPFHKLFEKWEDLLYATDRHREVHFMQYRKRGFGILLSAIAQAAKLYAEILEIENALLQDDPNKEQFDADVMATIGAFLTEQAAEGGAL
jgi:hypothetical protein